MLAILIATFVFFAFFTPVQALEAPAQISPNNNSTVAITTLNWQVPSYALYQTNPYRVQIDDDQNFSSPDKDYYTANTSYSPSLNEGVWYWKLKAKDSTGTWSDWSNTWNFTFSTTNQSPSPTPTPSPSSNPTPSPVPQNTFQISNIPSSINSNESFNVTIQFKVPSLLNQKIYIKGAFKKADGTNYFGLTKYNNNWIKNGESYTEQLSVETNSSGEWNGSIEIMPDTNDSGYSQTSAYQFKMAYYTKEGTGPNWSNQVTVNINHINIPTPTSQTSASPSPSPSAKLEETILSEGISTTSAENFDEDIEEKEIKLSESSPAVEGISFENTSKIQKSSNIMTYLSIFFGMIFFGASVFYYLRIRKNRLKS